MTMEDWVSRALARWPNVPHLYDWLSLDRHGRWRIRGEIIKRPQIIDTIARNYAADERGCWYFQNGPQRGYMSLETCPLVLQAQANGQLQDHCGRTVNQASAAYLDADGGLCLQTEHGAAALDDRDLPWLMTRLHCDRQLATEGQILDALQSASGTDTRLQLQLGDHWLPIRRLDSDEQPSLLGFARQPSAPAT